jgi:hypothetical protein
MLFVARTLKPLDPGTERDTHVQGEKVSRETCRLNRLDVRLAFCFCKLSQVILRHEF